MQFGEDRRIPIGLVVLLIPDSRDRDQPAFGEANQLAMYCACAGTCQRDHLGALKAPAWLAGEKSEHALLDRREEHVRQSGARRQLDSHIGNDSSQNGKDQAGRQGSKGAELTWKV